MKLSAREQQVLALLARGESATSIAKQLFLTRDTVREHIQSIYRKLGAHNRIACLMAALRFDIIRITDVVTGGAPRSSATSTSNQDQ